MARKRGNFKHQWVAIAIMRDDPDEVFWHAIGDTAEQADANLHAEFKALLTERWEPDEQGEGPPDDEDTQEWMDDNFDCPPPFEIKVPLP